MPNLFQFFSPQTDPKSVSLCELNILNRISLEELTGARRVAKNWKQFIDQHFRANLSQFLLKKTMTPFFALPNNDLLEVNELEGGLTNRTFKIKTRDGREYVARHPGIGSALYIKRIEETDNVDIAARLRISPAVVYRNSKGSAISDYLPQAQTMSAESLSNPKHLIMVTAAMKEIHTSATRFTGDCNVFTRNRTMLAVLRENKAKLPDAYTQVEAIMNQIEKHLADPNRQTTPCHNDTTPGNFILSQGKMWMIDWEYSGNNDPLWDLVNLSRESAFTD